jgi:hypothetical protein
MFGRGRLPHTFAMPRPRPTRLFDRPQLSFLVFASPKSGTTWMQRLLSQHPEAVCAESRLFGDFYQPNPVSLPYLSLEKYLSVVSNHFAPAVRGLRREDTDFHRALLANVVDTIATSTLRAVGKSVYGEKQTPFLGTAGQVVDSLEAYNPDVRFVNLTRDGRDVVVSGAAQWLNLRLHRAPESERPQYLEALERRTVLEEDFTRFLTHWVEAVTAGFEARGRFRHYLHVRYEAFLAEPLEQAARLFEFVGIDAREAVVRDCVEAASFRQLSGGRVAGDENRQSFFRKGQAGDWPHWLSADQVAAFEARAGALLGELGYPLSSRAGDDRS